MARALIPDGPGADSPGEGASLRRRRLLDAFRLGAFLVALFLGYRMAVEPGWTKMAAAVVAAGALLPVYLWCAGRVGGVPLFPLFSISYLWTYAYPLASGNPGVESFGDDLALWAGLTVSAALIIGTLVWYVIVRRPYRLPPRIREIVGGKGDYLLMGMVAAAALLTMSVVGYWGVFGEGVFSIVRSSLVGLSAVGIFTLAYRKGRGELSLVKKVIYIVSFLFYLVTQMATLFLVGGLIAMALFVIGSAIGARRIPWAWLVGLLALFAFLHAGKADMRERYWYPPQAIQPSEYPTFFVEWIDHGVQKITNPDPGELAPPLYERVGLAHLLLRVLDEAPQRTAYLMGETYAVIPQLLVPRIFNPDKPSAHEGTTILNVHYGIQSREDTLTTTIGWGMLNEAVANFGMFGVLLFGVATGGIYGWVTRVSSNAGLLSLRMLIAITFMAFAIQTEFTAGVYFSALFQSLVALFALSVFFMRRGGLARPSLA